MTNLKLKLNKETLQILSMESIYVNGGVNTDGFSNSNAPSVCPCLNAIQAMNASVISQLCQAMN